MLLDKTPQPINHKKFDLENGFFLANKPVGITSSDMVQKIKKKLQLRKIGHTGTLDKFAEGLMILPFGKYTVFSNYFLGMDKSYLTKVCLGLSTDSGDRGGKIIQKWNMEKTNSYFLQNKTQILREIENIQFLKSQIPPKISALKVNGKRQADLYRSGIEFQTKPRNISVYEVDCKNLSDQGFELFLHVSSGTYIRKIVMDLSEKLNFPMHIEQLTRKTIGNFSLENSQSLEELIDNPQIIPFEKMLPFPILKVDDKREKMIKNGRYIEIPKNLTENYFVIQSIESDKLLAWCSTMETKPYSQYIYMKIF